MDNNSLFDDLVALEKCSFPKKCATCGLVYLNVEDFVAKTEAINKKTGLKSSEGDEGETILELFRNCSCGSTLLDFFENRRDTSGRGKKRRKAFEKVLVHLVKNGMDRKLARQELLYYMKHKKSKILEEAGLFDSWRRKKSSG
ncbi:oxidoreductase [Aliikangiella coralliicola]|uniref:Oxidoreductase n=1 Tax=Aliikangiella coralliicola TaxID=2592383 RepID=A0A545TS31_9GAMM|nr:oxidoreductase [Aliikangiella coralliicola]TQV80022.1 oxidoreductase [Aliikangiella coralliicola]